MSSPYGHEDGTNNTMDILSVVFFLVAGAWLIVALMYSLLVLCFLRMRSNGTLGDIYDENFGRVRLVGNCYLPLGCIFRRYARHLQMETTSGELPYHHHVRFMTKEERRAAVQTVLAKRAALTKAAAEGNNNNNSNIEDQIATENLSVAVVEEDPTLSCTGPKKNDTTPVPHQNDNDSINGDSDIESSGKEEEEEETPLCSICLCAYEPDDEILQACPQGHVFHTECILDWLQLPDRNDCPCCRSPILDEDVVWKTVKKRRKQRRRAEQRKIQEQHQLATFHHVDVSETEQIEDDDDDAV